MPVSADSRIGTELAGYRIEVLIGRGGMGVVYRARDLALDRNVALKLLAPHLADDVSFRERFLKESRVAASLEHPNVVPIHDAGEIDGQLYIVMRLVEGSDLKAVLRQGPLEPAHAVRILGQIAGALDAAHARGLVHRDVKPSNVLLDEGEHAYLADFGLSRYLGDAALPLGPTKSLGTADYVAPEQIRGEDVDGRADVYALSCMLYECLAGEPPFRRGTDAATLYAQLEAVPPVLPGLEEVLTKALAKEPAERYAICGELIEGAREALGLAEPKRSRWPLAVAAIGVTLISAALAGFFLTRGDGGGVPAVAGADSLVRIDPTTNAVSETIPVGRKASGVAVGDGHVWVASFAEGTVWRIDPKNRQSVVIPVKGSPTGVAAGRGSMLVGDGPEHKLVSLDPAGGGVRFVTQLQGDPSGNVAVAAGREGIWFADATGGIAGTVEAAVKAGATSTQVDVPADRTSLLSAYESFDGLAVGEGAIWVAGDTFGRSIWRIDPASKRVVAKVALPFVPGAVAAGEGAVWVTSLLDDTVVKIDPASNRIVRRIRVGRGVNDIAAGDGAVWVTSSLDRVVSRIDPRTNRVVATTRLEEVPGQIAVGAGGVWLTTAKAGAPVPPDTIGIGILADCNGPFKLFYEDALGGAELALLHHGGRRAGQQVTDGIERSPDRRQAGDARLRLHERDDRLDARRGAQAGRAGRRPDFDRSAWGRGGAGIAGVRAPAAGRRVRERVGVGTAARSSVELLLVPFRRRRMDGRPGCLRVSRARLAARGDGRRHPGQPVQLDPDGWVYRRVLLARRHDSQANLGAVGHAGLFERDRADPEDGGGRLRRRDRVADTARPGEGLSRLQRKVRGKVIAGTISLGPSLKVLRKRYSGILGGAPFKFPESYAADLRAHFPQLKQPFFFDLYYHDAMAATLQALDRVNGDLSGGERRFMAALATLPLDSPVGRIRLDRHHEAIGPNYLVRFRTWEAARQIRQVDDVEPTFGGYFKPTDPPPSLTTPACVKRTPPPWAR